MDDRLWPARNVAEHAYCPRLFYLMEVEGLHLHNQETLQGELVHKKVNSPSTAKTTEATSPLSVRSLTLTSNKYPLTATLDLAVMDGEIASPIEYRKGKPNRYSPQGLLLDNPQPWPVESIQLALQAILLEEAGYKVQELGVYYAEEKLHLKFPYDQSLREIAIQTLEEAIRTADGQRPLPLLNDRKCVGCSMQPVCLPDEVNYQLGISLSPRKIWPPLDEGIQVVAQDQSLKIGIRGESLFVSSNPNSSMESKPRNIPLATMESLTILGNVQITTQAIHGLMRAGIPIAFLTNSGSITGLLEPPTSISHSIRLAQAKIHGEGSKSIEFSRKIVASKIFNQRTILVRNHPEPALNILDELSDLEQKAIMANSIESLLGYEGRAAALYFKFFGDIIKDEVGALFSKNGRRRRPPPDPINSLLSFVYTILTKECIGALKLAGLEPSIGLMHKNSPGRPALALDLMEPFRPLIADSIVISLWNRGEITNGHFLKTSSGYQLTDHGRKIFFRAYSRRLDTRITHPVFGYKLTYRRMLILHARMIAAWMLGEFSNLSFLTTR